MEGSGEAEKPLQSKTKEKTVNRSEVDQRGKERTEGTCMSLFAISEVCCATGWTFHPAIGGRIGFVWILVRELIVREKVDDNVVGLKHVSRFLCVRLRMDERVSE